MNAVPITLSLDDPRALDPQLVGAKAANLARARRAGLPTLPGEVLTTVGGSLLFSTGTLPSHAAHALRRAWRALSGHGARPLVVRSSSTVEDTGASSMAGRFTSVLDVRDWEEFLDAVRTVLDSATNPGLADAPMAVLVQPFLEASRGGVLFGADPVTGNADHLLVASVDGGPDALVSGAVDGTTSSLSRSGRLVAGAPLDRSTRRRLADLAKAAERVFGGPQDMEWALDQNARLLLLQARPITTPVHHPTGPRLGPGPVAETFPAALARLEVDLWIAPLRDGIREALRLSGGVSRRALEQSPVVVSVDGQVALDLDLVDPEPRRGVIGRIDPRPGARRLRASWRVGRLRAAFTALAGDVIEDTDGALLEVPPLDSLTDRQLLGLLHSTRGWLVALHGYEVLGGLLLDTDAGGATGAAVALEALADGRADGLDDLTIVERDPIVLSLVPPRVGPPPVLPPAPIVESSVGEPDPATATREALRIRTRWVHELGARAAWELASRLTRAGRLPSPELVRWLDVDELGRVVTGGPLPDDLEERTTVPAEELPPSFHLAEGGVVVPDAPTSRNATGAGGGRRVGLVHTGADPQPGAVLVVRHLDPSLAVVLPHLGGLVAETGNPLSHLAILAREYGVPTVVGCTGALERFRPGDHVEVDGTTGSIRVVDAPAPVEAALLVASVTAVGGPR